MQENVPMSLDVQVDEVSKKILANPEKCRSVLLDVTVIKPKELEVFGTEMTNTLTAQEVRKLISSLEKQRRNQLKYIKNLKNDDTIIKVKKHEPSRKDGKFRPASSERKDFVGVSESVEPLFCEIRRSLKNVETRITNMQDINLVISQTTTDHASQEFIYHKKRVDSVHSEGVDRFKADSYVYRASEKPYNDLKPLLKPPNHKNPKKEHNYEGKCYCENCGVIGLLSECQKHPLMSELRESQPPTSVRKDFCHLDCSKKIKTRFNDELSDDLDQSGFYLNHLTQRVRILEERLALQEKQSVPKEYFKRIITNVMKNITPKIFSPKSNPDLLNETKFFPQDDFKKFPFSPPKSSRSGREPVTCFRTNTGEFKNFTHKTDKSTFTDYEYTNPHFWRWGEDILKPGIDLKNRIITLMHDILIKFTLVDRDSVAKMKQNYGYEIPKSCTSEVKIYNIEVKNEKQAQSRSDRFDSCLFEDKKESVTRNYKHKVAERDKNVNVSYLNPKLMNWKADPNQVSAKEEFIKIVSRAKGAQKEMLWKNIWNQAKINGQSRDDKITIKIPVLKNTGSNEMFQTELTIKEVEEVLSSK